MARPRFVVIVQDTAHADWHYIGAVEFDEEASALTLEGVGEPEEVGSVLVDRIAQAIETAKETYPE